MKRCLICIRALSVVKASVRLKISRYSLRSFFRDTNEAIASSIPPALAANCLAAISWIISVDGSMPAYASCAALVLSIVFTVLTNAADTLTPARESFPKSPLDPSQGCRDGRLEWLVICWLCVSFPWFHSRLNVVACDKLDGVTAAVS